MADGGTTFAELRAELAVLEARIAAIQRDNDYLYDLVLQLEEAGRRTVKLVRDAEADAAVRRAAERRAARAPEPEELIHP